MNIPTKLELHVGEIYRLTLPGLAMAGYSWTYKITFIENAVVEVSAAPSEEPGLSREPLVGSSRDENFIIQAVSPGKATLQFVQRRSWEQQPPLKAYQIEVAVE